MADLTSKGRKELPAKDFAGPARSYPIENASHARNALARVSANGNPNVQAEVRSKVAAKFPSIAQKVTARLNARDKGR